jgi:hypothetical protein
MPSFFVNKQLLTQGAHFAKIIKEKFTEERRQIQ